MPGVTGDRRLASRPAVSLTLLYPLQSVPAHRRQFHGLLRLRPHARHLPEQVQQSREFSRLSLRAAAADGDLNHEQICHRKPPCSSRVAENSQRDLVVAAAQAGSARRTTTAPTSKAPASIAACCWCGCSSIPDLCAPFDPRPYPADWHLHRGEERYLGFVFDRCREVAGRGPATSWCCDTAAAIRTAASSRARAADDGARLSPARRVLEEEVAAATACCATPRAAALLQLSGRKQQ